MKSLTANGDVKAYLEPYATAEHFGPEGRLRPREELPAAPTYTVEAVKDWLEAEKTTERSIFVKELAYAVDGRYHVMPDGYKQSFIIRKPMSVFKSYFRIFSRMDGNAEDNFRDWLPKDVNIFKCLTDLVDYVESSLKQDFVIIDTDDVMKNPAVMMKKYCEGVGLIYNEGLLQWEQGLPDSWCMAECVRTSEADFQWMTNCTNSTGWGIGIKKPPSEEEELPQVVTDMAKEAQPYYEKLRNHSKRLLPDSWISLMNQPKLADCILKKHHFEDHHAWTI